MAEEILKPTHGGEGKAKGDPSSKKEIAQLTTALVEADEEIDSVSEEGSSLEDIERVKALAAEVLDKYTALQNRLVPDEARKLQQSIGEAVERIKKGLIKLKEAPE